MLSYTWRHGTAAGHQTIPPGSTELCPSLAAIVHCTWVKSMGLPPDRVSIQTCRAALFVPVRKRDFDGSGKPLCTLLPDRRRELPLGMPPANIQARPLVLRHIALFCAGYVGVNVGNIKSRSGKKHRSRLKVEEHVLPQASWGSAPPLQTGACFAACLGITQALRIRKPLGE